MIKASVIITRLLSAATGDDKSLVSLAEVQDNASGSHFTRDNRTSLLRNR